ncbi:hypothetical protein ILYODFUR_014107 [Ilyodon furcidens]|uniref:Uncharacterized protein n=1 Tax=Ilyodon furcidens TaxID=33524 RepID=A0ABV0SMB6_9TELE
MDWGLVQGVAILLPRPPPCKDKQEMSRPVPLLSSSEYGRRLSPTLNQTARQYARVASTKSEFYMKNGIIWSVAEGYGSVGPT